MRVRLIPHGFSVPWRAHIALECHFCLKWYLKSATTSTFHTCIFPRSQILLNMKSLGLKSFRNQKIAAFWIPWVPWIWLFRIGVREVLFHLQLWLKSQCFKMGVWRWDKYSYWVSASLGSRKIFKTGNWHKICYLVTFLTIPKCWNFSDNTLKFNTIMNLNWF